jgi:hypothetical protein
VLGGAAGVNSLKIGGKLKKFKKKIGKKIEKKIENISSKNKSNKICLTGAVPQPIWGLPANFFGV